MKEFNPRIVEMPGSRPVRASEPADEPDDSPGDSPGQAPLTEKPAAATEAHQEPAKTSAPTRFMQGILTGVDCSAPPSAVLTVVSGAKTWKMKVADTAGAIVFGADKFSCSWSKQKIAVNYRETGNSEGTVVSLEMK